MPASRIGYLMPRRSQIGVRMVMGALPIICQSNIPRPRQPLQGAVAAGGSREYAAGFAGEAQGDGEHVRPGGCQGFGGGAGDGLLHGRHRGLSRR